jgi:acetyl/propionyl-CoA carboxylase alpha subunit
MPLKVNYQNTLQQGHAIECRIYAEDPENNFFPATGSVLIWEENSLKGIRYDSGVASGSKVDVYYDPMIAKIIAVGTNREEAIRKMQHALEKFVILGLTTNKNFLLEILKHPSFGDGTFTTNFINKFFKNYNNSSKTNTTIINELAIVAMLCGWKERNNQSDFKHLPNGWRNNPDSNRNNWIAFDIEGNKIKVGYRYKKTNYFDVTIGDQRIETELVSFDNNRLTCIINKSLKTFVVAKSVVSPSAALRINSTEPSKEELFIHHPAAGSFKIKIAPRFPDILSDEKTGGYKSPMPGEVVKLLVKLGDEVISGKGLVIINSMKMETTIEAHSNGIVEEIFIVEKSFVEANTILLKISSTEQFPLEKGG